MFVISACLSISPSSKCRKYTQIVLNLVYIIGAYYSAVVIVNKVCGKFSSFVG